jgi:hypothetical protein
MKSELKKLVGTLPASESGFKKRNRFHQGLWRAFVLAETEGEYPHKKGKVICNTITEGRVSRKNFLSPQIVESVTQTIEERQSTSSGIMEENRLFNNLLSSQPLCFNFFGELKTDTGFALQVLKQFWPELTAVKQVVFEFAPAQNYTNDNSAFDVAFEVEIDNKNGLIGFECKYTDTFSRTEYDKPEYRQIFEKSTGIFVAEYKKFTAARYNQLFRNQLLAEALIQNRDYQFVYTGLFCHPDDTSALHTGAEFQQMLRNGDKIFRVITYQDFIEKIQRLNIGWARRELSMLLWARYCGNSLSEQVYT